MNKAHIAEIGKIVFRVAMKKPVFLTFMSLLFLIVSTASYPRPTIASGTIFIRANGNVEGTDMIKRDGGIYTLIDSIFGEIVVEKDSIVVDGADYILQGTGSGTGIDLKRRCNVTIKNMKVRAFGDGIYLRHSSENTISGSYIENNDYGILLWDSSGNVVRGNSITKNQYGIGLFNSSNHNNISENNITKNYLSIWLFGSSSTSVYHNNFVNNTKRIVTLGSVLNVWDDGYPSGGNYWSNYTEQDSDADGIGDTPYVIDENSQDNYPLMKQFTIPEFPTWTLLLLLLIVSIVVLAMCRTD